MVYACAYVAAGCEQVWMAGYLKGVSICVCHSLGNSSRAKLSCFVRSISEVRLPFVRLSFMANGGDSSSVTSSQFDQLMAAISGLKDVTEAAIDQIMAQLKRELVEEHGELEANERLAKKLRATPSLYFRKNGNDKQ